MIINLILILTGVSVLASIINLFDNKKVAKHIPMQMQLPGNLPIITLFNNNNSYNFIVDSGSNISHICKEYYKDLNSEFIGTYEEETVAGLGATNTGISMCNTVLTDIYGNEFKILLSISDQLITVANNIEASTGVKIHGLLGTDFLKDYKYIIDFSTFELYTKK